MYKKDPNRSHVAPVLRTNNGEGDFWAYRDKFGYGDWCAALQWIGNVLRHTGGRIRLWELNGEGHPVWRASSNFPSGNRQIALQQHSVRGRKFYDDVFCNVTRDTAVYIHQSLGIGAQFLSAAASDLQLPMADTDLWPKEKCPYNIEIP